MKKNRYRAPGMECGVFRSQQIGLRPNLQTDFSLVIRYIRDIAFSLPWFFAI